MQRHTLYRYTTLDTTQPTQHPSDAKDEAPDPNQDEALAALRALPADARDALLDEALSLADAAASPATNRRWTPRFSAP